MKRKSLISRRLMQRRAELEARKARKRRPSEQRARIIRAHARGDASVFGALSAFVASLFARARGGLA